MKTCRSLRAGLLTIASLSTLTFAVQAAPTTQIPAGTATSIGPAKTSATPDTPQGKILQSALTPETRQTLKDAMDADPTPTPASH